MEQICLEKGIFGRKWKKWTPSLNFTNFWKPNFNSNWQFDLDQIYPKRVFLVQNRKNEHHHKILHIRIGLGTKFQLRPTILIFWTKFAQKGYFQSKTENLHLCMCPWSFLTLLNFFARGPTDTKQDKGAEGAYWWE